MTTFQVYNVAGLVKLGPSEVKCTISSMTRGMVVVNGDAHLKSAIVFSFPSTSSMILLLSIVSVLSVVAASLASA